MILAEQIELMDILLKANPDARVKDLWFIMTNGRPQYYIRESKMNEFIEEAAPITKEAWGRLKQKKYLKTYKLPY